jgi:hypothetical protein
MVCEASGLLGVLKPIEINDGTTIALRPFDVIIHPTH